MAHKGRLALLEHAVLLLEEDDSIRLEAEETIRCIREAIGKIVK